MTNITKLPIHEHTREGLSRHLAVDKPVGGILVTKTAEGYEWRYFGEVEVGELVGTLEIAKHDLLTDYRAQSQE